MMTTAKEVYQLGKQAWRDIELSWAAFVDAFEARQALDVPPLEAEDASDFYLACACGQGSSRAVEAFEAKHFGAVDSALSRMGLETGRISEIRQALRQRFFVIREGEAELASYIGRGRLSSLFKVSAVRLALNQERDEQRQERREQEAHALLEQEFVDSPELLLIHRQSREAISAAFASALEALEAKQRNLLRLSILENLSIDNIAALYNVHRATAARWLAQSRDTLARELRKILKLRLKLATESLESLIAGVESHMDLSISRLLARETESDGNEGGDAS